MRQARSVSTRSPGPPRRATGRGWIRWSWLLGLLLLPGMCSARGDVLTMAWARLPLRAGASESFQGIDLEVIEVVSGCPQAEVELAYLGGGRDMVHYEVRTAWGGTLFEGTRRLGAGSGALALRFDCDPGQTPHHLVVRGVLLHPAGCGGH